MPGVRFEVDIDYPGDDRFAELVVDWLDRTSRALAGTVRDEIEQGPRLSAAATRSAIACGPPGAAWGFLSTARKPGAAMKRHTKIAYAANLPKLAGLLDATTQDTRIALYHLDECGMPGTGRWHLDVYAYRDETARAALRLFFAVPEEDLRDRPFQDSCRQVLFGLAAQHDPLYGDVTYDAGLLGETVVEALVGPPWVRYADTIGRARQRLRGYGWLTVVPRELAAKLGGAARSALSKAFAEVTELPSGALWLRATDDYFDYDQDAATRVVRALASVLPPGRPRPECAADLPYKYGDLDPAELTA